MFEELGFEVLGPREVSVFIGLALGVKFGALAQRTNFCVRRAIVGDGADRRQAAAIWITALTVALIGTQGAIAAGLIEFSEHRFFAADLPAAAIIAGGLMFGAGMILTRGCVSRLTVLTGTGNLRAFLVLMVFAIVAHATLKGVFAPLRTSLGALTVPVGDAASLAALPGGAIVWTAILAALGLLAVTRLGLRPSTAALAAILGLLVPLGWVGTGYILFDEFDPIAFESLSFTSPASDALFWTVASSSIPAGFGTGFIGGTVLGSLVMALVFREFRWQSFEGPAQTGRYMSGAALMGAGGVLAGGCSVGAGLSGIPTLSIAALLALASIIAGGFAANGLMARASASRDGSAAPSATRRGLPAE